MRRFEPGDRVVVIRRDNHFAGPEEGAVGTVLSTRHNNKCNRPFYSIMDMMIGWDNKFSGGHSCGGLCQNGHGWNFMYSHIGDLIDLYEESTVEIDFSDMEMLL